MGYFAKNFPQITSLPIDPATGQWTAEWYLFLVKLFQSTGGALGTDPADAEYANILAGASARGEVTGALADAEYANILAGASARAEPSVYATIPNRELVDPSAEIMRLRDELGAVKRYRTPLLKLTKTTYPALTLIQSWAGAVGAIPSGWTLCDGTAGSPDMRNLFVIGAGGTYAVGATGGSTTISANNLPTHTHKYDRATANTTNLLYTAGAASANPVTTLTETSTDSGNNTTTATAYLQPYYALAFIVNTADYTVITNVTLDD